MKTTEDVQDILLEKAYQWLTLISQNNWDEAIAMLDMNPDWAIKWTEEKIREVVEVDVFGPDTIFWEEYGGEFRYNDPKNLPGDGRPGFLECTHLKEYFLELEMPINEEWTDLTLTFEFTIESEDIKMLLKSIHVL